MLQLYVYFARRRNVARSICSFQFEARRRWQAAASRRPSPAASAACSSANAAQLANNKCACRAKFALLLRFKSSNKSEFVRSLARQLWQATNETNKRKNKRTNEQTNLWLRLCEASQQLSAWQRIASLTASVCSLRNAVFAEALLWCVRNASVQKCATQKRTEEAVSSCKVGSAKGAKRKCSSVRPCERTMHTLLAFNKQLKSLLLAKPETIKRRRARQSQRERANLSTPHFGRRILQLHFQQTPATAIGRASNKQLNE